MLDEKRDKKASDVFAAYKEWRSPSADQWEASRSEKYRDYRKRWVENPKNLVVPDFPIHIDIEATSYCNLRCPMCARTQGIDKGSWRKNQHIDFSLFKSIIDEGAAKGLCSVNLNYFGEPTLNPRLPEMVGYAKQRGIIDVFFHTHGGLLTKELSERLILAGLDRIIISFDMPYKEDYERIRVGNRFEDIISNIRNLKEAKERLGSSDPLIRINMIKFPEKFTEKTAEDMKRLFRGYADIIGFLELEDYEKVEASVRFGGDHRSRFICPSILSRLSILEDGRVLPCCTKQGEKIVLGNAKENSLEEIWNSQRRREMVRKNLNGGLFTIYGCSLCTWALNEEMKLAREEADKKK